MGDEWLLRKYWVQAQMNEHFNHISSAVDTYKDCLEVSFRRKNLPAVVLANCRFHSKISKETIKSRLQSISLEQYLRLAENEFSHGNFKSVLNKLHPFLFQDNTFPAWFSALLFPDTAAAASNYSFLTNALVLELEVSQRIRILTMLERAYSQTGMVTELFIARVFLVVSEVRNVLTLKGPELLKRIATLSTILKNLLDMLVLNEGQDLFRILKDNDAMLPVLDFMGCSSTENVIKDVLSGLFAAARLAWVIVKLCSFKRYQRDDVLVNFALRTWSVMYYVCKTLETKKAKRVGLEWLFLAHSQLGEVSICGRDDAFFLNLVIRICLAKKGGESMSELYQGFCCLYGLTNTVDPDSPLLEHNSDLRDFDEKAAAAVFAPLSKFVKDKLATQNYKSITSDIRDSIDTISEKFSEPPFKNYEVSLNRSLIDKFLVSGIHGKQTRSIGIVAVIPHKVEYYDLYKDIFFIRGKLSCIQRRAVVGVKTKKSFESLEIASEEFLHNLYMNPFSVNAWLLSADVYCSLSYEYLSWNANDIIANIQLIREYQLKSFHCYEQVLCLLKDRQFTVFNDGQIESNLTVAEHSLFSWGNFGFLCYSMIASPINCIAVKSSTLKSRTVWASRYAEMNSNAALVAEGFDTVEAAEALGKSILLSRGIEAFRMAHKADSAEWRYPFMLGKMSIMSDQDVEVVVDYFEKAIELLPEDSGMKEQETILDVHYCLVSFLCKRLYAGKVEPDYVIAVLEKSTLNKDGSMTPTETEAREDRTMEAYDKIQQELTYMKLIDKKKWQHRPYYKSYWLYKNIYNDLEKAKAELLNIFQLRSNARSFINFWKPEFERPGRHYVYIHKYTMALISVLRDLKDLESLRHLVRKSQKAYDVLLYPQAVWKAGFDAMNELLLEKVKEVTWTQFVKTIPQKEFLAHAPALEKKFMWSNNEERTEDASFLHTAFHLKKLNEGMEDDTLISRILVLLYCKLFLAHLETNASVEENETLAEDSSSYFALVLRRCLVACKIPWNKRPTAEQDAGEAEGDANAATNGAESSQGVATENGTARVEGNDVMQGVEALETSVENTGTHTSPEKNGLNAIDAPVQGVEDVEALDPAQFENIFNMNPFVKDKEGDISVVHEEI
ncbi:hypothetical protein BCR33DRAFT_63821 [Rhizoclosmatium globosum]|uniref:Histone transcription regulator 3 homolog n=1 Tax=Rhizoclosmatium globosum TaxID=329046 RepID=A0A1Y2CMQ3_9FUNG|nr:hypothetical protein BCR33DRAFT_63821 [Rhizoclosmatium globosum]|eukprot:ORY48299.1 hypothetical protein BCR33DRAFT_63821 [Rhizoclosmatium globosum]